MVASSRTRSGSRVDAKDPTDYFFFLVSFLVVIIFAIAPLYLTVFAKLNPTDSISLVSFENQLDSFAKVIVPLVIFGVFLGIFWNRNRVVKNTDFTLTWAGSKNEPEIDFAPIDCCFVCSLFGGAIFRVGVCLFMSESFFSLYKHFPE